MLSAAFAMFVCGWRSVFVPREKIPSIAETLTTCLSRPGARSMSGFSRAHRMKGATAFTSWTSIISGVDTSARVSRQEFTAAQVHLLEVGVERAVGEQVLAARALVEAEAHLGQARRVAQAEPGSPAAPGDEAAEGLAGGVGRRARGALEQAHALVVRRDQRPQLRGQRVDRALLELEQVLEEAGRPAHGLAGVVDEQVEPAELVARPGCRRSRRSASGAGRGRGPAGGRPSRRSPARARSGGRRRAGSAWWRPRWRRPAAA